MNQHLSLDVESDAAGPVQTVADLCRRITDTSGLPRQANITFTLVRGTELRAIGIELAL